MKSISLFYKPLLRLLREKRNGGATSTVTWEKEQRPGSFNIDFSKNHHGAKNLFFYVESIYEVNRPDTARPNRNAN